MSQTSFLEDVASWSEADCRERFPAAVPKLMSYLESASSLEEEVNTLQILTSSFLPCIAVEEAETVLYSKLVPKAGKSFLCLLASTEKFLIDASVHLQEVKEEVATKLNLGLNIIKSMEQCVVHANSAASLHVLMVHSLTQPVLDVIKGTYSHCKESSTIYGDLLVAVSDQLTLLFKRAHSLQVVFLALLDKLILTQDAEEQEIEDMCLACHELFLISQVVASLDVKIMVTSLKTLSRLTCQHKMLLGNKLDVTMVIAGLSNSIQAAYQYLFQLAPSLSPQGEVLSPGDEKMFMKSVKILGFQVKILLVLVKELSDRLGESNSALYNLLLYINRFIPPSPSGQTIPPHLMEELRKHVLGPMEMLISNIINSHQFIERVTSRDDTSPEDVVPRCLLQLTCLHHVAKTEDQTLDQWMSRRPSDDKDDIVQAVFTSVAKCHIGLCTPTSLPGVPCEGKPSRDVGLYEYIITRLSAFACSLPHHHFPILETCLLSNVLTSSIHSALMAIDVWCLVARYGSAELCRNHCLAIGKLLIGLDINSSPQYLHLSLLLRRLFLFLAPEHQGDFVQEFPVPKCCHLWSIIPIANLSPDLLRPTVEKLVASCLDGMNRWNKSQVRKLKDAKNLLINLRCLRNLQSYGSVMEHIVSTSERAAITNCTMGVWKSLQVPDVRRHRILAACVTGLTEVTRYLVLDLQTEELLLVLNFLHSLQKQDTIDSLRLSISHLLGALGKKSIPPSFQQSQILSMLPEMFVHLLTDPCLMVRQNALEAFSQFAEETPHEGVVPECLQLREGVRDSIVDFLNKVPHKSKQLFVVQDYLQLQQEALKTCDTIVPKLPSPESRNKSSCPGSPTQEPPAKRSKHNNIDPEQQCKEIISRLKNDIGALADLHQSHSLPSWVFDDLNVIQVQLSSMV